MPQGRQVAHSLTGRDWIEPEADPARAHELARRYALPDVVSRLLAVRGIDAEAVPDFLEPRLRTQLPDPSRLLDMDVAAERLAGAVTAGERLGIISDYDVDGCTSAALVLRWARRLGVASSLRIPHRLTDGYGPNARLLDELEAEGARLVLVLDSGTAAHEALAHAAQRGLQVIVVDHHGTDAELPPALAVVNPNRRDQEGPWGTLAAVGVTFLLLVAANRALRTRGHFVRTPEPALLPLLDLVALGTVADVVPLTGLNRALVSQGLKVMREGGTAGLRELASAAGLKDAPTAASIGFVLAPRLNAAGRLDDPLLAAELLATDDPTRAAAIARELEALNSERKTVQDRVADAAQSVAERQLRDGHRVLLACGDGWHRGVLGVVAGRLAEQLHRPVLVAARDGDEVVASGRAPEGYDLGEALRAAHAAGLAAKAGGHARAGGFTTSPASLDALHAFLEGRSGPPAAPTLRVDAPVAVAGANRTLVDALARLEPYGAGHPQPRLRLVGARITRTRTVGEHHLRLSLLGQDGGRLEAIAFRSVATPLAAAIAEAQSLPSLQLAGRLVADRYRGGEACELQLDDIAVDR